MSSRRQRNSPLGGRYRQVSLYMQMTKLALVVPYKQSYESTGDMEMHVTAPVINIFVVANMLVFVLGQYQVTPLRK